MRSPLGIPDRIGRYELLSELGRGSMGHVYLALDPNIERKVALKVFLPLLKVSNREEWELRQRFILEARAAGKVKHPGIVMVFDADTDPETDLSFIAMEWVDGPSLQDVVRESGPLPTGTAMSITEQVAVALDAAHREKLVHRDIKPANILLDEEGRPKITDFGIAKLASMSITAASWIPGSPFYMSPEQVRNEHLDGRSDLYSLGVVLYQCVTGGVPFESDSLAGITYMILEMDPRPPQLINPAVSDQLAQVIQRALSKSPADRFQSGGEFANALRSLALEEETRVDGRSPQRFVPAPPPTTRTREQSVAPRPRTGTVALPPPSRDPAPESDGRELPPKVDPSTASSPKGRSTPWSRSSAAAVVIGLLTLLFALATLQAWVSRSIGSPPTLGAAAVPGVATVPQPTPDEPLALDLIEPPDPEEPADAEKPPLSHPEAKPVVESKPPAEVPKSSPLPHPEPLIQKVETPATSERSTEAAAPFETPPAEPVVRPLPATLEVVFRNRLKNASISVFVDENKVWTESVTGAKSFFKRAFGKDVWTSLSVAAGHHVIDVRITGTEGKIDLVRRTEADFFAGDTKRLRIVLIPPKTLKVSWKAVGHG